MSEACYTLLGITIGSLSAFWGTYIGIKQNMKIESRRLALSYRMEKKRIIEQFISDCSFKYGKMEEYESIVWSDFHEISTFFHTKAHYFHNLVELEKLKKKVEELEEEVALKISNRLGLSYQALDVNKDTYKFIQEELKLLVKKIEQEK